MEKYKEGLMVAVLYSPGYGAGWYTWNSEYPELIFDPGVVDLVLREKRDEIQDYIKETYGEDKYIYCGGTGDLEVEWVEEGQQFEITEYDGFEYVRVIGKCSFMIA